MNIETTLSETVLVVEDDPDLRELTTWILEREGYTVVTARNGHDAMRLIRSRSKDAFDLVLTDITMPGMGGEEMAEAMGGLNPKLKILFTSGLTDGEVSEDDTACRQFLPKPCAPSALVRKVREVIDSPVATLRAA